MTNEFKRAVYEEYYARVGITWEDGGGDEDELKRYFEGGFTPQHVVDHQIEKYALVDLQAEGLNPPAPIPAATKSPVIQWVNPLASIGQDDPKTRLKGTVRILGADFHVNAEQVVVGEEGQESVAPADETHVDDILDRFCEGDGETVAIDGRDYLLVITPFGK